MKWLITTLIILIALLSCSNSIRKYPIKQEINLIKNPKIILVTIDGVRWQDVFDGPDALEPDHLVNSKILLSNFYTYFTKAGVVLGKESEVKVGNTAHMSLPGYYEILSGKVTTCTSNDCAPNICPTMVNMFKNSAVFGSWNLIKNVVNADTALIDVGSRYREDQETITTVEKYLNQKTPEFLWISLGDTDEWAHAGDYQRYWESLQQADVFIGKLVKRYGKDATIIVTTDHGRGKNWQHHGSEVESARTFLFLTGKRIPKLGHIKLSNTFYSYQIMEIVQQLLDTTDSGELHFDI